jgi:hypothetical protein
MRFVPQERDRLLGDLLNRPVSIVIAVGTRKNDNAEFHGVFLIAGFEDSLARWPEPTRSETSGRVAFKSMS